ncbi:Pyruvate formate-lyase-activating enzyme [compost metagenome]
MDSSGGCYSTEEGFQAKLKELIQYTDLVLLDLKHLDDDAHRKLTGRSNANILQFARFLSDHKVPVWVRHVLVPGYTDSDDHLRRMGEFIKTLENVKKIEVLPYHKLGVYKWETLGYKYPLASVEPPSAESVENAKALLGAADSTLSGTVNK